MNVAGILFMLLGLALVGFGLAADTTVTAPGMLGIGGLTPYVAPQEVSNISLLQQQTLIIHLGISAFISGVLFFGFDHVAGALRSPATAHSASSTEEPDGNRRRPEVSIAIGVLAVAVLLGLAAVVFSGRRDTNTAEAQAGALEKEAQEIEEQVDGAAPSLEAQADALEKQARELEEQAQRQLDEAQRQR